MVGTNTLWFTSCIGVDYSPGLIPHFLRHYIDLGIDPARFLIVLNSAGWTTKALRRAESVLSSLGIPKPVLWRGKYTSEEKVRRVSELLDERVSRHDWIAHADSDELQEYPVPLPDLLSTLESKGENAMKGVLLDRIARDGSLPRVLPDMPLAEQFPVSCHLGPSVLGLKESDGKRKLKLMLYRGDLRPNRGSGDIAEEQLPTTTYSETVGIIHHYKWTADVLDKLRHRSKRYRKLGFAWWRQSQLFLDYFEENGRIRMEDVRVEGECPTVE